MTRVSSKSSNDMTKQQQQQQPLQAKRRRKVDTKHRPTTVSTTTSVTVSTKKSSLSSSSPSLLDDPEFAVLDVTNPVHARRIQQRRRMVSYGKNTVGYDRYVHQVPKEKRRPRSMTTPSTPDHTLDIPNKRWSGMIRAWRRALHQYDPLDLQNTLADEEESHNNDKTNKTSVGGNMSSSMTVQDQEIAEAQAQGLLVDTGIHHNSSSTGGSSDEPMTTSIEATEHDTTLDTIFNPTTATTATTQTKEEMELEDWDVTHQKNSNDNWWADVDSDDDLL